jgi:phosphate-selective porin
VYGGSEHNTSFGVNWFINDNVRIGANYIRANIRGTGVPAGTAVLAATAPVKRQLDIFGLRFAVAF